MSLVAYFDPVSDVPRERRGAQRRRLVLGSALQSCGSPVVVEDLSTSGLLFNTQAALALDEIIVVHLPEAGATPARIVRCNNGRYAGEFLEPVAKAAISAALLKGEFSVPSGSAAAPAEGRLLQGRSFLLLGLAELGAGIAALVATGVLPAVAAAILAIGLALLAAWGVWVLDNSL